MIINTTSWHYRFNSIINPNSYATNLCAYFWLTMGSLLKCLIIAGFFCFGIGAIIFITTQMPIVVGFIISSIIIPSIAIYYFRKVLPVEKTKIRTPSFVAEYFKAKKNKYCPTIEYK